MRAIYTALVMYQIYNNSLPRTYTAGINDTSGFDYSSQGDFLPFLVSGGYLEKVPVDPINNALANIGPGQYAYRYFCYLDSDYGYKGLRLDYIREFDDVLISYSESVFTQNDVVSNTDTSFDCSA